MSKEKFIDTILNEMVLPDKCYSQPFMIMISGYSGSGKSHVARVLSKELSLYIVSGDNIRQRLYQDETYSHVFKDIQAITNEVCDKEIEKLLQNHISIVLDRSVSSMETREKLKEYGMPFYHIEITSDDEQNIERIIKRNDEDKSVVHEGYGDTGSYSGMDSREEYMEIKERKVYDIPSELFDYHIDGTVSLEEELEQAKKIAQDIASKLENQA